jgi:hypothetical protein
MIRFWVYVAIQAVVAAVLHLAIGADLAHTLMALVASVAVTVMLVGQQDPRQPRWPRHESRAKQGARDDVSDLSWSFMSRDDAVTPRAVAAVRSATASRLRLLGVDLDDPRQTDTARGLLGDEAYDFVESRTDHPTVHQLARTIDRLADLDPAGPTPQTHPTRSTP